MDADTLQWLKWARELQSMSQIGLTYSSNHYETTRYKRLAEISAEITEMKSGRDKATLINDFLSQPGYATPKVDVRGAISDAHGRILLVRERSDGCWCLPGGWADVGETPSEMVIREVREESGLIVDAARLVGVYDANRTGTPLSFFHAYKLVFLCTVTGGTPGPSEETSAVDYFPFDELPPLSIERTNERHLADVSRAITDATAQPAFD